MKALPLVAKGSHPGDDRLLLSIRHEALRLALAHHVEAERALAAAVDALSRQMALHVADALTDAIPLVLGHGAEDREDELADSIAPHVAPEVDHVQADALGTLEEMKDQGIGRAAEHAIELGRDHHITGLHGL
jgi:hypothetical protein